MSDFDVYCERCDRDFMDETALEQHMNNSLNHRICDECDGRSFRSRRGLIDHCLAAHFYCISCDRFFNNFNNLESHLASSIHQPRDFKCLGRYCDRTFISISALTQHLESGGCNSNFTRASVNRLAVRVDGNNVITNPSRLIRGPDGYNAPPSTLPYATEDSWNGSFYECFLCYSEFRKLSALDQHLQSPRHEDSIYRCPNVDGCGREFTVLSGLCHHVERDRCGVQRFHYAKKAVESLMVGFRRIEL